MNLQMAKTISTKLRIFEVLPKPDITNLEDYLRKIFTCTKKKVSLASITDLRIYINLFCMF